MQKSPVLSCAWTERAILALLVKKQKDAGPGRGKTVQVRGSTVHYRCRGTQGWPKHDGPGTNSCSKKLGDLGILPLALMEDG